jgi:hypothetical protein
LPGRIRTVALRERGIRRAAIATALIILILLILIAAAAGAYLLFSMPQGTSTSQTSSSQGTQSSIQTSHSSSVGTTSSSVTTSVSSSSSVSGVTNYRGTFTFLQPLGPFGINDSSGKPVFWNSTQSASGSFTFSINSFNYSGTGSGQGSITVTTRGYCTGSVTVPYTFTIQAFHFIGQNITVGFYTPNPSNATVPLTCQGSTQGFNQGNNPIPFLPVYPNLITMASVPAQLSMPLTTGISYTITIELAS